MAARADSESELQIGSALPAGVCNFRDLSREQAPTCPCRRFYLDLSRPHSNLNTSDSTWCFCGHHACFHDHDTKAGDAYAVRSNQVDDRSSISELASQRNISQEEAVAIPQTATGNVGLGVQHLSAQSGVWDAINAFARNQADKGSGHSSALPSTAVPSVVPTLSLGRGDSSNVVSSSRTKEHATVRGLAKSLGTHLQENDNYPDFASVTELNTPSLVDTPVLPRFSARDQVRHGQSMQPQVMPRPPVPASYPDPHHDRHPTSPSRQATSSRPAQSSGNGPVNDSSASVRELQNIVKACAQRLDLLESMSYTHVPLDEVEDKFEHLDGRLLSLEEFRAEIEVRVASDGNARRSNDRLSQRALPADIPPSFASDDAVVQASDVSSSSAISTTAAVYTEYNGRLESINQRIDMLEKAVPSVSQPWEVEVVLLPWGRHLPGVWMSSTAFAKETPVRPGARDEWTGATSTTAAIMGAAASADSGWSTASIQAWAETAKDWLSAKACGPNGVVYQRLMSRGFVQTIEVVSPDARQFLHSCNTAFSDLLPAHSDVPIETSSSRDYDALRELFVPLRKVRKTSRLRFLAPSEMVSSALWTPTFLESSVFMKSKGHHRRLYITFPEAYMQQGSEGWTWPMIRALRPNRNGIPLCGDERGGHNTAVDAASCWQTNAVLDKAEAASFASDASRQSIWSTKSQISVAQHVGKSHDNPALVSPISEHRSIGNIRRRTVSIPPAEASSASHESQAKRRIASFETAAMKSKRRKTSMSSQPLRPGPGHTPRLSREPPSPFTSDYPPDSRSDNASGRRIILTPLAYETPHSHTNNAVVALYTIDRDGYTEAETEVFESPRRKARVEDEWSGLGDEGFFTASHFASSVGKGNTEDTVIMRGSDAEESELEG